MAVTLFFSTKLSSQASTAQMGSMKMLNYLMPVMLLLWFNNYASGLSYYYFLSNLFTIGLNWGFRAFVNDDKLHAQMKANASKVSAKSGKKPKSKWQQRYEEMLKAQQQQAKGNKGKRR